MNITTILIIYHSQGGNNKKMAMAVADGASLVEDVRVVLKDALDADLNDLLECDGIVFRKPYTVFITAGNDGTGALRNIERICIGYQFKKVYEPIVISGEITQHIIKRCKEMGQTIAAGCSAGIY